MWFTSRLKEPSTWAGLGILYMAVEAMLTSGDWMTGLPGVLGALIAILKGEAKA